MTPTQTRDRKRSIPIAVCIVFSFVVGVVIASPAQTFTTLASLETRNSTPGSGALAQGTDGNFYGTSTDGGRGVYGGDGTVFRITPSGRVTTLFGFQYADSGEYPNATLVLGADGDFYGTTLEGGPNKDGTVFKITPAGALTTLYGFDGPDGFYANGLVQSTDGNFYGITSNGGANSACSGCGTVFKLTPEGVLTNLHSFDGTDGNYPNQFLQATDGNFYGTTLYGGAYSAAECTDNGTEAGCGTVFKITPEGALTMLHSFDLTHGALPESLIQANNGKFYGTTAFGGGTACAEDANGCGTFFQITSSGSLATLHQFEGSDGYFANSLVQANDGNFYGTTWKGGANVNNGECYLGCGSIFEATPIGATTTLYSFCPQTYCPDGENPESLMQGTDGTFYGTTPFGGNGSQGVVFSLSAGLKPFIRTIPTAGAVGSSVIILGYNLTGATAVSFNGAAAASFTVVSSTEITATVPTGATTGTVEVTMPKKTLKSNVAFRVTP